MDERIQAGKFKAECLKLMETVRKTRRSIIITKRNIPIASLVPLKQSSEQAFGKLKGTIRFKKNIIDPIDEAWNGDENAAN